MKKTQYKQSPLRTSHSSSDERVPATFSLFPRLPRELRLMIWRLTLPRPRRIRQNENRMYPITLSINQESRAMALQHYKVETTKAWSAIGVPCYVDYSADFIHEMDLPPFALRNTQNLIQEYADSVGLESRIRSHLEGTVDMLPSLKELLVIVHYRELYAYGPFKPIESQVQKKLQLIRSNIIDGLRCLRTQWGLQGRVVGWKVPNIAMETCKLCFRRRGGRHYTNASCKGRLQ